MAETYITDPELLRQLNGEEETDNIESTSSEYVSDPELLKQLDPSMVEAASAVPKSWWESITEPNKPTQFDPWSSAKNVAASTAVGAAAGVPFGITVPFGAAAGFLSGVGGEVAQNMGMSDLARFGLEAGLGEAPGALAAGARQLAKVAATHDIRAARAANILASDTNIVRATEKAKLKLFGKPYFELGVDPTNSFKTQEALRAKYLSGNISVSPDERVSSVLQKELYDDLKKAQQTGQTRTEVVSPAEYDSLGMLRKPAVTRKVKTTDVFVNSPEYKEMMLEMGRLSARDRLSGEQMSSLVKILKLDVNKDPALQAAATDDIINLIQNGGIYQVAKKGAEAETKTKIPDDARLVLRDYFNRYLERTVGSEKYNLLKQVQREEFIAEARDLLPTFVESQWRPGSSQYEFVLSTLKNSPEGKKDFALALNQHFLGKDYKTSKELLGEFNRLRNAIIESGIMSSKEAAEITRKINTLDVKVGSNVKRQIVKDILGAPLVSVLAAEVPREDIKSKIEKYSL